jgi:hypothetical protein
VEIIYVRTRNAGSAVFSNILRGQEGTTARTFVAGSVVVLRVTAADIQVSINIPAADNIFTGNNSYSTTNFRIEESGGKLIFKNGSTVIASLSSTGVFTALSDVTAGGTP